MLDALEQQLLQSLIKQKTVVARCFNVNWRVKASVYSSKTELSRTFQLVFAAIGAQYGGSRYASMKITRHGGCYKATVCFRDLPADLSRAVEHGLSEALTKELRKQTEEVLLNEA